MALIAAHLDAGIIHLGGDSVYSNMPEFCDEDGYDSPHKDQLKIFGGCLCIYANISKVIP